MGLPCERCLRRTWLLSLLAGHIDCERGRLEDLLQLDDDALVAAVAGRRRDRIEAARERFDRRAALRTVRRAGLTAVCRCDRRYPASLEQLRAPPAVLHVAGSLCATAGENDGDAVAIVGCRDPTMYGKDVARSLGRSLAAAGLTVVSGLALGIDSAAHEGALTVGGRTVAVLPARPERGYPASMSVLYRRIVREASGAAVSELPPGVAVRRWMFPARNLIIAALPRMTILVEGSAESGALLTARTALSLGRSVGAVPGRVTSPQAVAPHMLLEMGARLIRGPEDVLEALFGAGAPPPAADPRPALDGALEALLRQIAAGSDTPEALAQAGLTPEQSLEGLAALELSGYIRRTPGGRYTLLP